jgi:hypothetical protein
MRKKWSAASSSQSTTSHNACIVPAGDFKARTSRNTRHFLPYMKNLIMMSMWLQLLPGLPTTAVLQRCIVKLPN